MTTDVPPTPPAKRSTIKVVGIVLAVLLFGCCGLGFVLNMLGYTPPPPTTTQAPAVDAPAGAVATDAPASEATEASGPTIAPYDTEVPPEVAPAIGTGVAVGDSQAWVVAAVEDKGQEIQSGNQFIPNPKTTGRFILVNAGVRNTGTDAFFIDTPKIVDSTGREFDQDTDALILIDDDHRCLLEKLNPGLDKGCAWVYAVPADATGLKLKVSPGMFSEPVLFDLGQ